MTIICSEAGSQVSPQAETTRPHQYKGKPAKLLQTLNWPEHSVPDLPQHYRKSQYMLVNMY